MRLSDDERAYHERMVEQVRWAQQAQAKAAGIQAAWQSWAEHLKDKYDLDESHILREDGTIVLQAEDG